jgi:hypothetical protein
MEDPFLLGLNLGRRFGKVGPGIQVLPHQLADRTVRGAGEFPNVGVAGRHTERRKKQHPAQ